VFLRLSSGQVFAVKSIFSFVLFGAFVVRLSVPFLAAAPPRCVSVLKMTPENAGIQARDD
jgi:hypothetical protein